MARLFFIEESDIKNNEVSLNDIDSRHLKSIRTKVGDDIKVIVPNKFELTVKITSIKNQFKGVILNIEEIKIEEKTKIHIIQSIPKLDKMEYIIQKLAELNINEIIPVYSRNSDIKKDLSQKKIERWSKISREASIQSGRLDILILNSPINLNSFLEMHKEKLLSPTSLNIVLYEEEKETTLKDLISKVDIKKISDLYIFIGPEGGIHRDEIEIVKNSYDFKSIYLKGNILRTETAAIAISSIMKYIIGMI